MSKSTCLISIDREGSWFYNGSLITNENICLYFARHIARDVEGNFVLRTNKQVWPISVERTPFIVKHCSISNELEPKLNVLLNDLTTECIPWRMVWREGESQLYCLVKDGQFTARFNRNSQYELASLLEFDKETGEYYLGHGLGKHYLASREDDRAGITSRTGDSP